MTSTIRFGLRLAGFALFFACGPSGATVVVHNGSATEVRDVAIAGKGFRHQIDALKPGEMRALEVSPHGESGVAISFVANGRQIKQPESGYFEANPSYVVLVEIKPNFGGSVETTVTTKQPNDSR